MAQVLCHLPKFSDPDLLVGFDTSDDAAVFRINQDIAIIQTVDIFPPIVDDPYTYGKIAAANALSDVYAMGGRPKLAMNIFCFPEDLPKSAVTAILQGGYEKVIEADALICGGHTIQDPVPKYGLSVTGFIHPDKILRNNSLRQGDILILTKALGTGIMTTAEKGGLLNDSQRKDMCLSMETLNRYAAEYIELCPAVHACTDVTGFGLLGHAFEMASGSGLTITLDSGSIPALAGALEYAPMGLVPVGAYKNRQYLNDLVTISPTVNEAVSDLMFDPQTSGGLLISVSEKEGRELIKRMNEKIPAAKIIGYVDQYKEYPLIVK